MSYDMNQGGSVLDGTIHRSDDDGKTWRVISVIRRRKPEGDLVDTADLVVSGDADALLNLGTPEDGKWLNTDEGDVGRLVLVVRPDGGTHDVQKVMGLSAAQPDPLCSDGDFNKESLRHD